MKKEENLPTAFDYVFPVFGGKNDDPEKFEPIEIFGTAFYISNDFYITCAHTVENASQCGAIMLGNAFEPGKMKYEPVTITETHNKNDSAIIKCYVDRAKSNPWLKNNLELFQDVASLGYPYGLDNANKEVMIRGYKGHITMKGFSSWYSGNPHYELSYQVPRGLSGAPLLHWKGNVQYVTGMTVGNEITDMVVSSFKEVDEKDGKVTLYDKTESLHRGIAMQNASLFGIHSDLLGNTLADYLAKNGLLH